MKKLFALDGIKIFILVVVFSGLAMGLSDSVLSNYFKEAYDVTPAQRGFIEFPRELPGVIALFIIGALSFLKNIKTAIIAQLLAVTGISVLGFWEPSFTIMLVFLFVFSLGVHMYMPLNDSIGLSIAKARTPNAIGKTMGMFNSSRMAAFMVAGLIVFFGFRNDILSFETPILLFIMATVAYLVVAVLLMVLRKKEPVVEMDAPVNAKFVFRKEYIRYYVICALFGGRKQIMLVYSPWVLIELLGFRADTMSILAVIGSFIGIFFLRLVGKWIDKYGVRNVMMIEACSFIFIYVAYGFLSRWLNTTDVVAGGILLLLVYILNIIDRMTAQFSMDRAIYMKSIALTPEDVTPSLSLGMSIDHLVAIAGAMVCGFIWNQFGPEYVFIFAGFISLINLFVAKGIKLKNQ
ncbi:MAG: MFS transporter [Oscillospiraceae bacterium]|nr:MFS transporter [Oscillospiraceae bacterium]